MEPNDRDRTDAALLEALFTRAPAGLFVLDPDLRVVRFNTAARGMRGLPPDAVVGRTVEEFAPGFPHEKLTEVARAVLATGNSVRRLQIAGTLPHDPEHQMVASLSVFRLSAPGGRVLGLAVMVEDITEQQATAERLAILHDAQRLIGSTLDASATAGELAEVAIGRFADIVIVDLLDDVLRGRRLPVGPVAADAPLRRTVLRSVEEFRSSVPTGTLVSLTFPTVLTQSMHDHRPRLIARLTADEPLLAADPERARRLAEAGAHSLVVAPLTVHGTALGLAVFIRAGTETPYDEQDLELAAELADRTALSVHRAWQYLYERTVATTLQRRLLPARPPDLPAVDTAYLHLSGDAGADWFDVVPLSGGRVALVCGTVAGRGVEAAATMGQLRTVVQTLARQDLPPEELLGALDETVRRLDEETVPETGGPAVAASCLYLVYDPVTGRCSAAAAGHPTLVPIACDGGLLDFEVPVGPALGRGGGEGYEAVTTELPEGSLLALHTRGLTAGADPGDPAGRDRLRRLLAHPDRSLRELCDDVAYAAVPHRLDEDALLLLARTKVFGSDRVAIWTLPADPAVVATARTLVSQQLTAWGLDAIADDTELIVSELVTNAIRYGRGPVRLRLIRDRGLLCEVTDGNSAAPHMRLARSGDEGGRGLFLVMHLSRTWGTRYGERGKTVWSEQRVPGPVGAATIA
ncbi:PAS domain S-box-containing protein [Streptomyces sp. TLI_235]|nr:SpoIIE family protein phosphatase [Streptomyces sp. TLI_235]PBC70980.1 PAS domain S-box-containing protein [Streptomyces sp. TLI_235]